MSPEHEQLAAQYVIGLLDGNERRIAERLSEHDVDFQAAVAQWQSCLAELDATATPVLPEGELWSRIETGLRRAPAPLRIEDPTPVAIPSPHAAFAALWQSLRFWRITGLAGAFASLLLALGVGLLATRATREPVLIAVLLTEQNRPAAVVNAFANGEAELIPLEAIPVPPGRALEIWTLWDRARGPVSIGLIDQARTVRLNIGNLPQTGPNQLFEITLEPATGSPTGRPTGPVLMKGTTSTTL
ncbi:anti-sigma factor [Microvirga aerilata]|uniref:Anti-sigma factor n=1 Tax=Microvirga aerilata TaxID=670292 RepID=A0A936ZIK5_9HYPH|nr:anti-sigma factor [Microvirga aerilata]MBL0407862.1 anti-sigma factor [Microvirga aerilata]